MKHQLIIASFVIISFAYWFMEIPFKIKCYKMRVWACYIIISKSRNKGYFPTFPSLSYDLKTFQNLIFSYLFS